jgi:hypothetical protein
MIPASFLVETCHVAVANLNAASVLRHVGFRGKTGKHMLHQSITGYDPFRTFTRLTDR